MSPYTNLRDDEYGGSLTNRMRFPLEVVRAVRTAIGDGMPLLYRMSGHDYVDGGLTEADSVPFAQELERSGVDLIDVSAGTYESITVTQPPMEAAPGALVDLAAAIKSAVTIPVATAGKLAALDVAEGALAAGKVDFVSIARGLHADPELLLKARQGRLDEVRRCIACAECVAFLNRDEPAFCAVNPASIRELELLVTPAVTPKTVAVIGGGPAGLEAARTARLRGHDVSLYEATVGTRRPSTTWRNGARARGLRRTGPLPRTGDGPARCRRASGQHRRHRPPRPDRCGRDHRGDRIAPHRIPHARGYAGPRRNGHRLSGADASRRLTIRHRAGDSDRCQLDRLSCRRCACSARIFGHRDRYQQYGHLLVASLVLLVSIR